MKLTISGLPGAGKTTVAKKLAEHFELQFLSIGNLKRKMAADRSMTVYELNQLGELYVEKELDAYSTKMSETEDNFIVEARLGFYFVKNTIDIFLEIDPDIGIKRIYANKRWDEQYSSFEEAKKITLDRIAADQKRLKDYCGADYLDKSNFDIVINTTHKSEEEVFTELVEKIESYPQKEP